MLTSHHHRDRPCHDGNGDIVLPPSLPRRAILTNFRIGLAPAPDIPVSSARPLISLPAPQNCTPRVRAPSTTRFVPVMKLAARLARNTAARAISSGRPMRPVGLRASAALNRSGLPYSILSQTPPGNQVLPGDTVLARMP